MSITTYTELQAAVENWLGHTLFTARVPEFIALFEANVNRRLRLRQQETTASLTVTSGDATLPTDFLAAKRLLSTSDGVSTVLEQTTPDYLTGAFPTADQGSPRYYAVFATTLSIRPVPSSSATHSLLYYAKVPALAGEASGTNWLLTSHPDLYLFGALIEAEAFGVNDNRIPLWKARRDEIYEELIIASNRSRGAGVVRVAAATP